jgi:ethanolamine ammonia-lyase small subunit
MTRTLADHPAHWDDGEPPPPSPAPPPDPWATLRAHTPARIALGRAGTSLPTNEVLRFAAAHAGARDAVHLPLDVDALLADLRAQGLAPMRVDSCATSRVEYLTRPDLGRQLSPAGRGALDALRPGRAGSCHDAGLCIVIADGLSAIAAQRHAAPLVAELERAGVVPRHVVVATQARVALADEIGECLGAALVVMLLGERPGLSSPDSLGAYLTWAPRAGRADSERNCVSNIRPEGLPLPAAAGRIAWLVREAQRRRLTGIALKDESEVPALGATGAPGLSAT